MTNMDTGLVFLPNLSAFPLIFFRFGLCIGCTVSRSQGRNCRLEIAFEPRVKAGVVGGLEWRTFGGKTGRH